MLSALPIDQLTRGSLIEKHRQIDSEYKKLKARNTALNNAVAKRRAKLIQARKVSQHIAKRTARNAAMNTSSVAGESIPYIGAGLVGAVTVADIKDGCDTLKDIDEMMMLMASDPDRSTTERVCGLAVPDVEKVLAAIREDISGTVAQAKQNRGDTAQRFYEALAEILN